MTSKPYITFALIIFGLGSLRAQDKPPGPFFRTFGVNANTRDLFYSKDGNDVPITVANQQRSNLFDAKVPSPLLFYKIQNGPDGKPLHVPVGQVDISKTGNLTMLFFFPNPAAPGTYQIQAAPDDLVSFPLGSYQVINLTPEPVKLVLDTESMVVEADALKVINHRPDHPNYLIARVFVDGPDGPTMPYADTWAFRPNLRTTLLMTRNATGKGVWVVRQSEDPTHLLDKANLPKD